jgi:hypothetical protein
MLQPVKPLKLCTPMLQVSVRELLRKQAMPLSKVRL